MANGLWIFDEVGPDGKPRIREFGNVKPSRVSFAGFTRPEISIETEPLVDVTSTGWLKQSWSIAMSQPG